MNFKVAGHLFNLSIPERYIDMLDAYRPFQSEECYSSDHLFSVEVIDAISCEVVNTLFEDLESRDEGMTKLNVYETAEGLLYNIIMPRSNDVDARLHIVGQKAYIAINDNNPLWAYAAFTNAMILSYITYTLPYDTLLLHASAIIKDGNAHLFIGKSGTGKSTHSRMWQEAFADAELLNDDHPIVRCHESGEVIAYGSPWSGKTPCYRNISAPLRGIIRIKRAPYNKLTRLKPIRGYASVMSSCSSMHWSEELANAKVVSLENIITRVGCYEIECLPEDNAARCCYESLCKES